MKINNDLKRFYSYATSISEKDGRISIETDNGIFDLCKKCGCVLGQHSCKKFNEMKKRCLKELEK